MPPRIRAAVAAALLLGSASALAYHSKVKGKPLPYQGFAAQGPTGLRLVAFEIPTSERATLGISHRAGSSDDPPGKEGMAHLVEHLAFRGRPGGALRVWDRLEAAGVEFNAFTTHDQTTFHASGRADQIQEMAAAEGARIADPLAGLTAEEFARERDVVLSELREQQDHSPTSVQVQWLLSLAVGDHPYGRPVIGTESSLRGITLDDARSWVRKHYAPEGAIAVVASPLPAKEAAKIFEDALGSAFFGQGPNPAQVRAIQRVPPPLPDPRANTPLERRVGPVERPTLWVAWLVPGRYSGESVRATVAAEYVAGRVTRRLQRRKDMGGERYVDAVHYGLHQMDGTTLIWTRIELRDAADAEWAYREARGVAATSDDNVGIVGASARERLLVSHYGALEEPAAVGEIAQWLRVTRDPDYLGGWQKMISAHVSGGIDDYLRSRFPMERAVGMLVVPDRNPRPGEDPVAHGDLRSPALDDAWTPPSRSVTEVARPPGLERAERRLLQNGLEVVVARRGAIPVAEARLVFRTDLDGTDAYPAGTVELALLTLTTRELLAEKEPYGISTRTSRGPGWLARTERGSAGNLDKILEFTGRWARGMEMGDRLPRMKDELVRSTSHARREPGWKAQEAFLAALFPSGPLGVPRTEASIRSVTSAQVEAWADASLRPDRATLVVVSNVEPDDELWSEIESELGGWKGSGKATAPVRAHPAPPTARTLVLVDQPGSTQPLIRVGFASPPPSARDDAARETLSALLDWSLQRRLRVESGVTYGVSARWVRLAAADPLVVTVAVAESATVESLGTILGSVAGAASRAAPAIEVQRARWQVARRLALGFGTVRSSAWELGDMAIRGRPAGYWEAFPASLATVDPARVQAAARDLAIGREAVVITGDASRLRPRLEKAGYTVNRVVGAATSEPGTRPTPD